MEFEDKINQAVTRYTKLLDKVPLTFVNNPGAGNLDFITRRRRYIEEIHKETMNPTKIFFEQDETKRVLGSILLSHFELPYPDGKKIRHERVPESREEGQYIDDLAEEDEDSNKNGDGLIVTSYLYDKTDQKKPRIEGVSIFFKEGMFLPVMKEFGEVWRQMDKDNYYNETESGIVVAKFTNSWKGTFESQRVRKLKSEAPLKVLLSNKEGETFVQALTIPTAVLGRGDVIAFFKHARYNGLDRLYQTSPYNPSQKHL